MSADPRDRIYTISRDATDLAQAAGLSAATLTAALQGRAVSLRTVQKIAVAISRTPAIPEAVELLQD